ncbi:hypothetical protein MMC21_002381 [Puttea exsequens]|nr:hypothetical protein [Puttea exsequens]
MHSYSADDLAICLGSRKLLFAGDSIARQLFRSTASRLGISEQGTEQHANFSYISRGIAVEFLWDPFINSTRLLSEVRAATGGTHVDEDPALLFVGGGLWYPRYHDNDYFDFYTRSIDNMAQVTTPSAAQSDLFELMLKPSSKIIENLLVFAPVLVPSYGSLSLERAQSLTASRIDPMNHLLRTLPQTIEARVAWSFNMMTNTIHASPPLEADGLHLTKDVASRMADILLNLKCNAILRRKTERNFPLDKTCCNAYDQPNWTQATILNGSMALLPLLSLIKGKSHGTSAPSPSRKTLKAFVVVAYTLCFCYYADRTYLYNKEHKQFQLGTFLFTCTAMGIVGIVSRRQSMMVTVQGPSLPSMHSQSDAPFLSRDQTDEWKGWMQIVILIYHRTGGSKVLWLYKLIRLLVASYLFMSGFGHTRYFYKRGEYSLRRCAGVLIRLNMLSCLLPYVMKTDYLFYYFAPLISFWYLIVYFTMGFASSRNKSIGFVIAKVAVSAVLTTALIRTPGVLELLFKCLQFTCNIQWDVKEWRFRLQLDSYIVYSGMLFAFGMDHPDVIPQLATRGERYIPVLIKRQYNRQPLWHLFLLALTGLFIPYQFAYQAPDKTFYNKWLPYWSFAPIIAFVIIRNINHRARRTYSPILAWVGRHSLETFILQYHIWLAADTKGLLTLGVFDKLVGADNGRRIDFVLLTVIFLWVSWHVAAATQTLTNWIVDPTEVRENLAIGIGHDSGNEVLRKVQETKVEVNWHHRSRTGFEGVQAVVRRLLNTFSKLIAGDLRVRVTLILGALWLLNVVSRSRLLVSPQVADGH